MRAEAIQTDQSFELERSKRRVKRRRFLSQLLTYIVLTVLGVFFLFPFFVMICLSILSNAEVNQQILFTRTGVIYLGAYKSILSAGSNYLRYMANTLIVSVICAVGIPFVSSLCAYGFSKLEFKGRDVMFAIVLGTMMIPSVISIVPLYTIYARLGWLDTLYPLFVPSLFGGGAVNIFLMRQFMLGIPNDLLKSAKLDGANSFVIFIRLVIPLCIPIFLYVSVISFFNAWGDFMGPYTYITIGSEWTTLALGVYWDYGPASSSTYANSAMAAGVVMMLPCIILFLIFQNSLIEGVSLTGIKG